MRRRRLFDRDPAAIDFLSVADDARDRAEPAGDPHRARIGEGRKAAVEHARIELVGLAVDDRERRAGKRAAIRGAPRATTGSKSSSTKASSERRKRQRVEPRGWRGRRADRCAPAWGALKTNGTRLPGAARQHVKGGSKSSAMARLHQGALESRCRCGDRTVAAESTPVHGLSRFRSRRHALHGLFTASGALWRDRATRAHRAGPADAMKILLAEDDNDMRRFLVKALQNAGYDVVSFDNGAVGLSTACARSRSSCC